MRSFIYFLFGASLCLSISATYVFAGLALIDLIVRRKTGGDSHPLTSSPLDIPIALTFVWGVVCSVVAGSTTLFSAMRAQYAVVFFFVLAHMFTLNDWRRLAAGFCVAAVFAGIWGVIQVSSGVSVIPATGFYHTPDWLSDWPTSVIKAISARMGRAVGTRSHPLTYAESLIPAIFLIFFALQNVWPVKSDNHSSRLKWLWSAGLAIVLAGLLASQSRGAWVGVLVGGLIVFFHYFRSMSLKSWGVVLIFSLAGLIFVAAVPSLRGRALSVFSPSSGTINDQQSKSIRGSLWTQSAEMVLQHPMMGVGIKGVRLTVENDGYPIGHVWTETHNIFLQAAAERGLIGLGLLLWVLAVTLGVILKFGRSLKVLFLSVFAAMLIAGLTESWLNDKEVAMIFWALLAAVEFFRRRPESGPHVV